MAGSPSIKVFNPSGEYVAACKYFADAACLVAFLGEGATVRLGHTKRGVLWTEGQEEISAGESYDRASDIMWQRSEPAKRT